MSLIVHDTLTPALRKAASALEDKKPVLEAMALLVESATRRSFNDPSQRATPWPPLSPATLARKRKAKNTSTAILKQSTLLWKSWHTLVTNTHATVSSPQYYAAFHQFGTRRGLPSRPMLPYIGQGDSAQLAPFIRQKVITVAEKKIASLLRQKAGITTT
jgi:phage gpG-like protein